VVSDLRLVAHFDTGRSWRGGQNQVYLLIRELEKKGVKQILIAPKKSPLFLKSSGLGVKCMHLDPLNDLDFFAALKLKKIIKAEKADILHFHTAKALGIGSWGLKGLPVKTVFTRRVDFPVSANALNRKKYKSADVIAVISKFIEKQMLDLGFNRMETVYSAVDSKKFRIERDYSSKKAVKAGMIGALDLKHKDFITFLKTALLFSDKDLRVKFLIAGSGKDEKKIRNFIAENNLGGIVEMRGFVDDIENFIAEIDILVHTVNYEGLGTVILQAMASGLPVIATDAGGIPEIVKNGRNGFLTAKGDFKDTSRKLTELAVRPDLRERFGRAGRKTVEENFSPESMAQKYLEIYERLV